MITAASLQTVYDGIPKNEHDYLTNFQKYYNVSSTAAAFLGNNWLRLLVRHGVLNNSGVRQLCED